MLLSIIIPCYNTEKYLQKCIDSILHQTISDYEIILVDDGSTDKTGMLCDELAENHACIKVLHAPNGGPATAKNRGYDIASGKYISFIDSDDELLPTMYEEMTTAGLKDDSDIVCCGYTTIDGDTGVATTPAHSDASFVCNREEATRRLLDKDLIYSQCWTKIYRKDLLDSKQIRFIDGLKTEEDFLYNLECIVASQRVSIIDKPLYLYTYRSSSLSREYYIHNAQLFLKNLSMRLERTQELIQSQLTELESCCIHHCIFYYNVMIGRAAHMPYSLCKPYLTQALRYIRSHKKELNECHEKCGISRKGKSLLLHLPACLYFLYRRRQ